MAPLRSRLRETARRVIGRLPGPLERAVMKVRVWQVNRGTLPPSNVAATDNVGYNRSLWDWYAGRWSNDEFRAQQLSYEGRAGEDPRQVVRLGDEWGRLDAVDAIVKAWVLPHVSDKATVGEIGTGGARVASMVAPEVGEFHAFDISSKLLERARAELRDVKGAQFHHLQGAALPEHLTGRMDFMYSFDVFVHLDLHVQWRYFQELHRVLRPGSKAFIHTSNLASDEGWERFALQDGYRVEGFYFVVPEIIRTLASHAGLVILEECNNVPGNFYTERDHLVLLQKPPVSG